MLTRRELMQAAAAAAVMPLSGRAAGTASFCLFSKHLPDLGWSDLGRTVKDAGFDGVYVHQIGPEQDRFFEFYSREVLPAVSKASSRAA